MMEVAKVMVAEWEMKDIIITSNKIITAMITTMEITNSTCRIIQINFRPVQIIMLEEEVSIISSEDQEKILRIIIWEEDFKQQLMSVAVLVDRIHLMRLPETIIDLLKYMYFVAFLKINYADKC